jgi:excisionase family DNA binding protein
MPTSPPISATEASLQTGIPKRTLLWAIRQGKLKAHKLSGSTGAYVIDPLELDRYIAEREQAAS